MTMSSNMLLQQAVGHLQSGRFAQAEELLSRLLDSDADNFNALYIAGVVQSLQRRLQKAVDYFYRALALNSDNGLLQYNLAAALSELGRDDEAMPHHERAAALVPNDPDVWVNYGRSLSKLARRQEALDCYARALQRQPSHVQALSNQGALLTDMGRFEEALASFEKALTIDPKMAATWMNAANALGKLKRHEEALDYYERALRLNPDHADTWSNRGNALASLRRHDEALNCYDHALRVDRTQADAWFNRGMALASLGRYDEASGSYDEVIRLQPSNADAWFRKAHALHELKRHDEAIEHFEQASRIKPELDFLLGEIISAKMAICEWTDISSQCRQMADDIAHRENVAVPFTVLGVLDAPALQRKTAEDYARHFSGDVSLDALSPHQPGDKIRLGYYSRDFRNHATGFLTAELFELHDRNRFDVTVFSYGPAGADGMRQRISSAADRFIDVRDKSDKEIAQLSRELGIDIALDVQGYQTAHRAGIFACRAAPIQVNYLAYPGTMGAPFIDYLVADATLVTPESRKHYSEKIVYLPDSYQPNDRRRAIADRVFSRQELGLPERGFVYCCFNTNYKITSEIFDIWMRILAQVEGSVLWLFEGSSQAVRNLRKEATQRGIAGERLVFAQYMEQANHLARHRVADLFLDTLPYNAHTTASDALWAGLPVLTCPGESFASRVSASLLRAVNLPDLVTATLTEYEQQAIGLARDAEKLAQIKQRLADNRLQAPLFDTPRYVRHLEAAYATMFERSRAGLPAADIHVPR